MGRVPSLDGDHSRQKRDELMRLLTFEEAVAVISKVTGRNIRYVPVSPEQYASALLEHGLPPDLVTPLIELFTTVLDGRNARLTDGVWRALGQKPRDFADYARDAAASGVWAAPSPLEVPR